MSNPDLFKEDIELLREIWKSNRVEFDVSVVEKMLMSGQDMATILQHLQQGLNVKQYKQISLVLQSSEIKNWIQNRRVKVENFFRVKQISQTNASVTNLNEPNYQSEIEQVFSSIKQDILQLKKCILASQDYTKILEEYNEKLDYNANNELIRILESDVFKQLKKKIFFQKNKNKTERQNKKPQNLQIHQQKIQIHIDQQVLQEEQIRYQLNQVFKDINFDITKLKLQILAGEEFKQALDQFKNHLVQYKQIQKILFSSQFKNIKVKIDKLRRKQGQKMVADHADKLKNDHDYKITKLKAYLKDKGFQQYQDQIIPKLLSYTKTQEIMKSFKKLRISVYQKLKMTLQNSAIDQILDSSPTQSYQQLISNLFKANGIQSDMSQFIIKFCNGEQYQNCIKQAEDITFQQKQILQTLQNGQQIRQLKTKCQIKNKDKLQIKHNKKIRKLFQQKGININLQQLINNIIKNQSIVNSLNQLQKTSKNKQYNTIIQILISKQFQELTGYSQNKIKKTIFINNLFKSYKINNNNVNNLKYTIILGQNYSNQVQILKRSMGQEQINKIVQVIKSEELMIGFKKISLMDFQDKKYKLLAKMKYNHFKNEEIADRIILGLSINNIYNQIADLKPQSLPKFQQQWKQNEMREFFINQNIEAPKYIKKYPISWKQRTIWCDQNTKTIDFLKKYSITQSYRLFNHYNQMLMQQDGINQPLKAEECDEYQVIFQNKRISIYLPYFAIKLVKPILQKILKTNLKLQIQIFQSDGCIKADDNYDLKTTFSRKMHVSYYVKLLLNINNDARQKQYQALSKQSIQSIQIRIQKDIGIKKQNQQWHIDGQKINKLSNTLQQLQITGQEKYIYIEYIKTLEFYGFQNANTIKRKMFKEFYIEDDQKFVETIRSSDFPSQNFSQIFKNEILGYIFSAIKKHSPIENALKHIQGLVQKCDKQEQLWKPNSLNGKYYFNQTFVLYDIVKCSEIPLRIDIFKGLMSHMPIPYSFFHQNGKIEYLFREHYWIQNKAFNIVSFGHDDSIYGKSKLLNLIFEVNFCDSSNIHISCRGGIQIQYNIFQSDQYHVNLIDVSNGVQQNTKIQIAKSCNLIIIHHKTSQNIIEQWVSKHQINSPIIMIQRDVENAFQKQTKNERLQTKMKNQRNPHVNVYKILKLSDECVDFFKKNINQIANGIQQFVRNVYQSNEKNNPSIFWKFSDYLSVKTQKQYQQFNNILKDIEFTHEDLSKITNIFNQYRIISNQQCKSQNQKINQQKMQKLKQKAINLGLAEPIKKIIHFCSKNFEFSSQIMGKLRNFLTLLRNQLFKDFNALQMVNKKIEQIKDLKFEQLKTILLQKIVNIRNIKSSLTTTKTSAYCDQFIKQYDNYKDSKDLQPIINKIKVQFEFQIQPKAFSVENFWREVIYMAKFKPNYTFKIGNQQNDINLNYQITRLGEKQVQDSRNFQFINGDLLQMPTQFLSKIFEHQKQKKVMIVAVIGPQSSGKSTLLNYILGCDFMSSAGRCTKGVYGTYFQISNRIMPNCQAILVLDTEGLFSTYSNDKFVNRVGFDNKLVLFCLQVCDIIILNTMSDISQNCQDVFDLAFDSQLIDPNYLPQMYIVLNKNGGQINNQQSREIQKFCDQIISINPSFQKVFKKQNQIGLPMAFNQINRKSTAHYITKFLKPKVIPSETFYKNTKKLCFEMMNVIIERGKQRQGRTLQQAFVKMDQTWSTINKYPILTKFTTKKLKNHEQKIKLWMKQRSQQYLTQQNQMSSQIQSIQIDQLAQWKKSKETKLNDLISTAYQHYQANFPLINGQILLNDLIQQMKSQLKTILKGSLQALEQLINKRKYKQQIQDVQVKGVDIINDMIRKLKQQSIKTKKTLKQQMKVQSFQKCWKKRQKQMQNKFERQKHSLQSYNQILIMYDDQLRQSKGKKNIQVNQTNQSSTSDQYLSNFDTFQSSLRSRISNNFKNNPIFEGSNQPPIMNIQKKRGDLTFKYLDMSKYFHFTKNPIYIELNVNQLKYTLNLSQIKKYCVKYIESLFRKDVELLIQGLYQDFLKIGVEFSKFKFTQLVNHNVQQGFYKFQPRTQYQFKTFDCILKIESSCFFIKYFKATRWINSMVNQNQCFQISNFKFLNSSKHYEKEISILKQICYQLRFRNGYNQWQRTQQIIRKFAAEIIKLKVRDLTQSKTKQKEILQFKLRQMIQDDLKNINLRAKWQSEILKATNNNFVHFEVDQNENNFIFENEKEVKKSFSKMSKFWMHDKLQNIYSKQRKQSYLKTYPLVKCIGKYQTSQFAVLQKFKQHNILKKYINKERSQFLEEIKRSKFTQFIQEQLKYEMAFDQINNEIIQGKIGEKQVKLGTKLMISKVNTIIQEINKDLKQVSQKVRYDFIVQLHRYAFNLIWKSREEYQWQKVEKIINDFNNKKEGEKKRFLEMLSGNSVQQNSACAEKLLDEYIKFINQLIQQDKKRYLDKRKMYYKKLYSRDKVQLMIDNELFRSNQAKIIYNYLMNPVSYIKQFYQNIEKKQIKMANQYRYQDSLSLIDDFIKSVQQFRDKCGNQLKSNSQDIFQGEITQNKDIHFVHLFAQVLLKEKDIISQNNGKKRFVLRQGRTFAINQNLDREQNKNFVKKMKKSGIQITNLKLFLNYFVQKLKQLQGSNMNALYMNLNQEEVNQYQNSLQVNICSKLCPCCKRVCDVDTQFDLNHTIHKCTFGHQMRAIGGMRIQNKNAKEQYKASVLRCEDIKEDSIFQFDGVIKQWSTFKLQHKKQWDYSFQNKNSNEQYYRHYWQIAGELVCKNYEKIDGYPMHYVPYKAEQIKLQTRKISNKINYIFGLDQSGSMQGIPWESLIQSMKKNLTQIIQKNTGDNQVISIFKFNNKATLVTKYQQPIKFNMNRIVIQSGGTMFTPAFQMAYNIMSQQIKMDHVFIFISDGLAQNPQIPVQKIKKFKEDQKAKGFNVDYVSILIGSHGGTLMQDIRKALDGQHNIISNANQVSSVFRQVMIKRGK